jgi:rubredoxin
MLRHPRPDGLRIGLLATPFGGGMAIEMTGGKIVNERGTVVTFRQKCENCGYVFDWNKTTIVPAYSSRKVRPFTCPECGNYQEVEVRYLHKGPTQERA